MPYFFIILFFTILSLASGSSSEIASPPRQSDTAPNEASNEIALPPPQDFAALGEALILHLNDSAAITGENMVISFDEVLADGRCPATLLEGSNRPVMMQCTASLPVEVAISVRRGDTVEHMVFSADTDTLGNVDADVRDTTPIQESGGHIIALEQVLPFPRVGTPRVDDAYTVVLRVTRDEEQGPVTRAPASIPARFDQPVTLHISQTAILNPGGVKVTVTGVSDQRCPALTICADLPIVVVDLDVQADGQTKRVSVGGVTDKAGHVTGPLMESRGIPWAQAGDYAIELTDVTPYPQPRVETDPAAYAVTLVISASERRKPTPASPTPTPAPTPVPTAESDVPVLSFDASGYPLLCVSELALVRLAAGDSDAPPVNGTPLPVGRISLVSEAAGDEICAMFFDDAWRIADTGDLTTSFAAYLPAEGAYWVWDADSRVAAPWEAGQ